MTGKPKAPSTLATTGKALWSKHVGKYDFRVDEMAVLEMACKTADTIATLDKEWESLGKPFMTTGSTGQDVIHPIVVERRVQQAQLASLLGKLKIPDGATPGAVTTNPARAAATTRWKHGA